MSARIRQALNDANRAAQAHAQPAPPAPPAQPTPTKPAYRRVLIAKPLGSTSAGVVIDDLDFAATEVVETVKHPAGYLVHRAYCNDGKTIEITEIPADQVRAVQEGLDA